MQDIGEQWDWLTAGTFAVVFFPFGWLLPAWLLGQLMTNTSDQLVQLLASLGMLFTCITPMIGVYVSYVVFGLVRTILASGSITRGGFFLGTLAFSMGGLIDWWRTGFGFPGNVGSRLLWASVPGLIVCLVVTALMRGGILRSRRVLHILIGAMIVAVAALIYLIIANGFSPQSYSATPDPW